MKKYGSVIHKNFKITRSGLLLLALLFSASSVLLQPQTLYAHGGVIMDGGFTPEYEWLVLSANSPLVEGPNLMSFVLYDIDTYAPIDGMRVEVFIAHQSSDVPCCNADDHVGPIELEADPENWPGDYSYELPLDGFGNFELKFVAYAGDSDEPAIEAISNVLVLPDLSKITPEPNPNFNTGGSSSPLDVPAPSLVSPLETPQIAATPLLTVTSSTTPAVPATTTDPNTNSGKTTAAVSAAEGATMLDKLRSQWMLWAAAGLIPLALLVFLLFRPSVDEIVAQKEAELGKELDEDLDEDSLDD